MFGLLCWGVGEVMWRGFWATLCCVERVLAHVVTLSHDNFVDNQHNLMSIFSTTPTSSMDLISPIRDRIDCVTMLSNDF